MADSICPTFAAGTLSLVTRSLNDFTLPAGTNGYTNENPYFGTVGSFNNSWVNEDLTQSVTPTFSTSLVDFGRTGLQS